MPQICDMRQTALLPLLRKACWGIFRPGSNPRSWVPEASMLTTRPPKPLFIGGKMEQTQCPETLAFKLQTPVNYTEGNIQGQLYNFYTALHVLHLNCSGKCYIRRTLGIWTSFFLSNATICPHRLRGSPSWLWPKCNRPLRLGRP
jgi:hypothetical protein